MEALCKKFGPIRFIKYTPDLKDSFTNRAEVHFENTEDAEACVTDLNNHKLGEKIVSAAINNKHSKVVVIKGEVKAASDHAKEAISKTCEVFGKIAHVNITESSEKSRFVCFVEFLDKQHAEQCFLKLSENPAVTLPGTRGSPSGIKSPVVERYQEHSSPSHYKSNSVVFKPIRSDVSKERFSAMFEKIAGVKSIDVRLADIRWPRSSTKATKKTGRPRR